MSPEAFCPSVPLVLPTDLPTLPFALSILEIDFSVHGSPPPSSLLEALFNAASLSLQSLGLLPTGIPEMDAAAIFAVFTLLVPPFPRVVPNLRHLSFAATLPLTALNPLRRTCTSLESVQLIFQKVYSQVDGELPDDTERMALVRTMVDALLTVSRLAFNTTHAPFPDRTARYALSIMSSPSMTNIRRLDVIGCPAPYLRNLEGANEFFAECERREILVVCGGERA